MIVIKISFDPETFKVAISREDGGELSVAMCQMILDEARRTMAEQRRLLLEQAQAASLREEIIRQQILNRRH